MDKKIIFSLLSNVLIAFSVTFAVPIFYAVVFMRNFDCAVFFAVIGICVLAVERILKKLGSGHRRRLPLLSAAISALLVYPTIAVFGFLPFLYFGNLPPLDALLDTISNLTSAGISLLPQDSLYILKLWQSVLMWFGSLIFLVMLVTVMPEISGCFGMTLSLPGKQNFSPIFGQMLIMAQRMIKVYTALTIFSVAIFKFVGLDFWDSILMAMRCISTGGGNFFPARENIYVEYAAAFTMLLACGNFLLYYRLIITAPPPIVKQQGNFFNRGIKYFKTFWQNINRNAKRFLSNSEVKATVLIIFIGVGLINFSIYQKENLNVSETFMQTFFHVISFLSTTGIHLETFKDFSDFDKFLIYMMAIFGGCMGSVTGGVKIMRVIVLMKIAAAELEKTIHPRMVTIINVNKISVPQEIIGRILGFFFLSCITLFVCAAGLSISGLSFSESVGMSFACLTNLGNLPGLCDPENFLNLPSVGKIFCMAILIIGRLEIFAVLILIAGLIARRNIKEW